MKTCATSSLSVLFFCYLITGSAQGVPSPSATLQLSANDARGAIAPAGSLSTLLTFTVGKLGKTRDSPRVSLRVRLLVRN